MIIPICDGNDDEVFECESKHEQLLASPSSESSSASKPRPGPLLLRVSCPGPWEWLRVEQQPLNYADSSHNRGWEKVCERQSRRFFDALASRKPPSDSKPVFLFFPSFSLSLHLLFFSSREILYNARFSETGGGELVGRDSADGRGSGLSRRVARYPSLSYGKRKA